jgi:hypothetical protein
VKRSTPRAREASGYIEIRAGMDKLLRELAEREPIIDPGAQMIVLSMKRCFAAIEGNMAAAQPDEAFQRRMLEAARSEFSNLVAELSAPKLNPPPRGFSALYREAIGVLEREGADTSAKGVLRALQTAGVVKKWTTKSVRWVDDNGRPHSTAFVQFAKRLSDLRRKK